MCSEMDDTMEEEEMLTSPSLWQALILFVPDDQFWKRKLYSEKDRLAQKIKE